MIDPDLLAELDATAEVQALGRSAVLRRAVEEYLERQRLKRVAAAYRRAYAQKPDELAGWTEEGSWPTD